MRAHSVCIGVQFAGLINNFVVWKWLLWISLELYCTNDYLLYVKCIGMIMWYCVLLDHVVICLWFLITLSIHCKYMYAYMYMYTSTLSVTVAFLYAGNSRLKINKSVVCWFRSASEVLKFKLWLFVLLSVSVPCHQAPTEERTENWPKGFSVCFIRMYWLTTISDQVLQDN